MSDARTTTAGTSARGGTVTVEVTDELDLATVPALRRAVERALRGRPHTVVVDLSGCGFLGVDALGLLVGLSAAARRQGTTLTLAGLSDVTRRVIDVLELDGALRCSPPEPRRSS